MTDVTDVDMAGLLADIAADIDSEIGLGTVADYIPALARVEPDRFGMAVAELDGTVHGVGDWREPFSIQSVSKVFALALAMACPDGDQIWQRVGREPSGTAFNSLVQLEHENGIPRNPFVNAGALVVTDELARYGDSADAMLEFLRTETGSPLIDIDTEVSRSETANADRNLAMGYLMSSYGVIHQDLPTVIDQYARQCAIAMTCEDLSRAGLFLARHGIRNDGSRLLTDTQAKRINAIMLTCGTYDAAGEFAFRVGLPGKSGVGGGILAVAPGRCTVAVWSPGLDSRGNSLAGVAALDRFTTVTGWSVFLVVPIVGGDIVAQQCVVGVAPCPMLRGAEPVPPGVPGRGQELRVLRGEPGGQLGGPVVGPADVDHLGHQSGPSRLVGVEVPLTQCVPPRLPGRHHFLQEGQYPTGEDPQPAFRQPESRGPVGHHQWTERRDHQPTGQRRSGHRGHHEQVGGQQRIGHHQFG